MSPYTLKTIVPGTSLALEHCVDATDESRMCFINSIEIKE